jgi:hypothetical protein
LNIKTKLDGAPTPEQKAIIGKVRQNSEASIQNLQRLLHES